MIRTSWQNTIALLLTVLVLALTGCTSPMYRGQSQVANSPLVPPSSLATPFAESTLVDPGRSLPPEYQNQNVRITNSAPVIRNQNYSPGSFQTGPATAPATGPTTAPVSQTINRATLSEPVEAPLIRAQYTQQNVINQGLNAWNGFTGSPATAPVNAPAVTYGAPTAAPPGYLSLIHI